MPFLFNDTTREFFRLMATVSSPEDAARYRAVLGNDAAAAAAAHDYLQKNEPRYASMLHTTISPTIISGGYRSNVIPSEAKATLDVRMMREEDPAKGFGAHSDQERILEAELYRFVRFSYEIVYDLARRSN